MDELQVLRVCQIDFATLDKQIHEEEKMLNDIASIFNRTIPLL
jgi:hypothetical protein